MGALPAAVVPLVELLVEPLVVEAACFLQRDEIARI